MQAMTDMTRDAMGWRALPKKTYGCRACQLDLPTHDECYHHWLRYHSENATPPKGRRHE